jgi:hypothetical protein
VPPDAGAVVVAGLLDAAAEAAPDVAVAAAEAAVPDAELVEVAAPDAEVAALAVPAARAAAEPWAAAWISLLPWPARPRSAPTVHVIGLSPTAWP